MNISTINQSEKNIWISTTGYRIFLILKSLLEKPRTVEELMDIIKNDIHCGKEISKDTLRCDINTLKSEGCEITKPLKTNDYKFHLISHPFNLHFSQEETEVFFKIRECLAAELSLNEIIILNDLYEKISSLTQDEGCITNFYNTKILSNINPDILKELSNPVLIGKKVQIKYFSPEFGVELVDIVPLEIIYENNKAYISAYNCKYRKNSYFEISRVAGINSVSVNTEVIPDSTFNVVYEVIGNALEDFELKIYEKIIEKTSDCIRVEAKVENEFMFTQRLLLLGKNFRLILPEFYRERLINKIKLIQAGYKKNND